MAVSAWDKAGERELWRREGWNKVDKRLKEGRFGWRSLGKKKNLTFSQYMVEHKTTSKESRTRKEKLK